MFEVKCPNCGILYEVSTIYPEVITCADCGREYHQGLHNNTVMDWVYKLAHNIRHYGR